MIQLNFVQSLPYINRDLPISKSLPVCRDFKHYFVSPSQSATSPFSGLRASRLSRQSVIMTATSVAVPSRRWVVRKYGEVQNLRQEDVTVQPPGEDEVRIRVRAIGLNFADVFAILGLYEPAGPPPLTPGFEACGVIDAIGSAVTSFKPGDRVLCVTRFGGYSTYLNVNIGFVQTLPEDWTFAEGAAFPAQAFTAWYALFVLGGLPTSKGVTSRALTSERKSVLIHSAAGGVGLQLIEMVKHIGGLPVCTIGSESKIPMLEQRGIPRERIIVRGVDDVGGFEKVLRDRALGDEGGLDVIVDSVMGEYFQPGYNTLNIGGRYIVMGAASIMPRGGLSLLSFRGLTNLVRLLWKYLNRPKLDPVGMINENRTVCAFNASYLFGEVGLIRKALDEIFEMKLPKPTIGRTFNFDEAPEALSFFQSGKSVGKIVLVLE